MELFFENEDTKMRTWITMDFRPKLSVRKRLEGVPGPLMNVFSMFIFDLKSTVVKVFAISYILRLECFYCLVTVCLFYLYIPLPWNFP